MLVGGVLKLIDGLITDDEGRDVPNRRTESFPGVASSWFLFNA